MERLKEFSEIKIINFIRKKFSTKKLNILGIGDDCAIIPYTKNKLYIYTTDMMNEDIHFIRNKMPAHAVGYKALARSLSDIAAMGGVPKYAFLAMALPKDLPFIWLKQFIQGFQSLAKQFNVMLLGGDTSRSTKKLMFDVGVLGIVDKHKVKYRSSAKLGDIICTVGFLGHSAAGLYCLLNNRKSAVAKTLINEHFYPQIQQKLALWLAAQAEVHAMTDLSDGIYSDLQKICIESKCGAKINLENLLISKKLSQVTKKTNPYKLIVTGGEDYQLLFTIKNTAFPAFQKKYMKQFSLPLQAIGKIAAHPIKYYLNDQEVQFHSTGFSHFL